MHGPSAKGHSLPDGGSSFPAEGTASVTPAARILSPGRRTRLPPPTSGRERRPAVAAARGLRGLLDLRLRSASDPRPQSASRSRHQADRPILPDSVWKDREIPRSPQPSRIWDLQSEATAVTITKRPAGSGGMRKTRPQSSG